MRGICRACVAWGDMGGERFVGRGSVRWRWAGDGEMMVAEWRRRGRGGGPLLRRTGDLLARLDGFDPGFLFC